MSVPSKHSGFTLIETIVVISLLVIVGAAIGSSIQYFYKSNTYIVQEGAAVQNAQKGLTTAMQSVREASYGDDGSYPILSVGTSTITFYADIDGDGSVEKIHYYLLNGLFYQGITDSSGTPPTYGGQPEAVRVVASYVQNSSTSPVFQYYDKTGALLSSPVSISAIATVTTTLKIDVDIRKSPNLYTLLGTATLRNLRS